ncbi:MAG: SGNH/GDSL hydrolase family protein [Gammaproteobacteria bacterium]|nr:SGNH/GDSL hydrolase family protein [Gammaproteobacteria bacterium]
MGNGAIKPRRTAKFLAILVVATIAVTLVEVGLHILWHNPYRNESPDHLVKLRMHHPESDRVLDRSVIDTDNARVRLRTDKRSYILPSFQYSDPDATVAFLGGSTTECSIVEEELRFPALVSRLLKADGLNVNTLNAARSGNTVHDSLNVFINHVSFDSPDVVVLMHASNDIGILSHARDYRSRTGHPVSTRDLAKWAAQMASQKFYFFALIRHVATTTRAQGGQVDRTDWRYSQQPFDDELARAFRQKLLAFVQVSRALEIEPVLMTQPFSGSTNALTPDWLNGTAQDQFNIIIREVGKDQRVLVIDLVEYLQQNVPDWDEPMAVFYDAIHVTDRGSQLYATHISSKLKMLLKEQLPRTSTGALTHLQIQREEQVGQDD